MHKIWSVDCQEKIIKIFHPDAFLRCKVCQKCLQHFSRPLVEFKGPTSKKRGEEGGEGRRGEGKGKVGVGGERKERERVIPVLLFLHFEPLQRPCTRMHVSHDCQPNDVIKQVELTTRRLNDTDCCISAASKPVYQSSAYQFH